MNRDIDKKIEELIAKTKGNYITQGCAFNKNSPRQMELLKFALQNSESFSGLIKELLAKSMDGGGLHIKGKENEPNFHKESRNNKNVGNFI